MIGAAMFVIGAAMGSFACCQAWRIRKGDKSRRSHCMSCGMTLKWYDNIPIVSWVLLRGKCRGCGKKIGAMEIFAELFAGVAFLVSYLVFDSGVIGGGFMKWGSLASGEFATNCGREMNCLPQGNVNWVTVGLFAVFLVELVILTILFVYDAKWKELPVKLMVAAIVVAAIWLGLKAFLVGAFDGWLSLVGALMILPGFYYLMYKMSRERLVGAGDWVLCVALALLLGNFWLAMFALFAANMLGSIVSLPLLLKGKGAKTKVAFGPFLIVGTLIVLFAQEWILQLVQI